VPFLCFFSSIFSSAPETAPAVAGSSALLIAVPEQPHREFAGVRHCLLNATVSMRVKYLVFSRETVYSNAGTSFLGRYPELPL